MAETTYGDSVEVGILTALRSLNDTVNVEKVIIIAWAEFALAV